MFDKPDRWQARYMPADAELESPIFASEQEVIDWLLEHHFCGGCKENDKKYGTVSKYTGVCDEWLITELNSAELYDKIVEENKKIFNLILKSLKETGVSEEQIFSFKEKLFEKCIQAQYETEDLQSMYNGIFDAIDPDVVKPRC